MIVTSYLPPTLSADTDNVFLSPVHAYCCRKVRQSHFSVTVHSHFSATLSLFCDSVDRALDNQVDTKAEN